MLAYGLDKTDQALRSMIDALKHQGIYDSTLFIVTAKHGQSPINLAKLNKPGHFGDLVAALPGAATDPAAQAIVSAANCATGAVRVGDGRRRRAHLARRTRARPPPWPRT